MDRRMEPNWRYFNEDAWYIRYTCEDAAFSCKMILIHIDCRNYAQIFRLLFLSNIIDHVFDSILTST